MSLRTCERCGATYTPRNPAHPTRFCSKACARVNAKQQWVCNATVAQVPARRPRVLGAGR
jgi:endogenous inhibitor of DNA gyrase (YacG/DUF329 family)